MLNLRTSPPIDQSQYSDSENSGKPLKKKAKMAEPEKTMSSPTTATNVTPRPSAHQVQGLIGRQTSSQKNALISGEIPSSTDTSAQTLNPGRALIQEGDGFLKVSEIDKAMGCYRNGLKATASWAKENSQDCDAQHELGSTCIKVGGILQQQGKLDPALVVFRDGITALQQLAGADALKEHPQFIQWHLDLSMAYRRVGILLNPKNAEEALTSFRDALGVLEKLPVDTENASIDNQKGQCLNAIGRALMKTGDNKGALNAFSQGWQIRRYRFAVDPSNEQVQQDLSYNLSMMANLHNMLNQPMEALAFARESLAIDERLAQNKSNERAQKDVAISRGLVKKLIENLRGPDDPNESLLAYKRLVKDGQAKAKQNQFNDAITAFTKAVKIAKMQSERDPNEETFQIGLFWGYRHLGEAYKRQGNMLEAIRHMQKSLDVLKPRMEGGTANAKMGHIYAQGHIAMSELMLALPTFHQAGLDTVKNALRTWKNIADFFEQAGEPEKALRAWQLIEKTAQPMTERYIADEDFKTALHVALLKIGIIQLPVIDNVNYDEFTLDEVGGTLNDDFMTAFVDFDAPLVTEEGESLDA